MPNKKANYLPLIFLPIIIFLCFGLWVADKDPVLWVKMDSTTGVFDMREIDFHNTIVGTSRTVEYIPGELLTPEEFALRDDIMVGNVPKDTKVSTMRVRYLVPDDVIYGIVGYSVNYASSVYINGKWIFDEGKPANTQEDEENSESYRLISVQPVDGVIEIVINTSCFIRSGSSSGMDWWISEYENARVLHTRSVTEDVMVMSFYIFLALMSLLLFLVLPALKVNGWLSLLSLAWALRIGIKSRRILLTLFPNHTWDLVRNIEALTIPVTVILLTLVLHCVFTGALPKWLRAFMIGGSTLLTLSTLILPQQSFIRLSALPFQVVYGTIIVMLGFIIFNIWRTKTKPTLPQIIILIGMGLVIFAFMWDESFFGDKGLPFSLTSPMMLVFTMFMLVAAMLETMQKTVQREVELVHKVEMQEMELLENRVAIMLSQIQPHFLYNSLTAIGKLCDIDLEKTKEAVNNFAHYLRGNLDSLTQRKLIPFEDELTHIETYLALEQLRFGEKLRVAYEIDTEDFKLPPLTVQPIVENAVRYGLTRRKPDGTTGGTVTVRVKEQENAHQITITDDGVGFDPATPKTDGRSHTGITNVRDRIAALCDGNLELESAPGVGTTVVITIPNKSLKGEPL